MKFAKMKGILGNLGVMRIPLKENAKPVKQYPYRLNPRYKEKVRQELDKMIIALKHLVSKPVLGGKIYKWFAKFPGKFCMHITNCGTIQLTKLSGEVFPTLVNGSRLKLYRDNPPS
jgi:hypothetical protein